MKCLSVLGLVWLLSQAWAHNAAPPVALVGVRPCVEPASVQLALEGAPETDTAQVRRDVYSYLTQTLKRRGVPYIEDCASSRSFVLIGIYARFLDSQSYIGFPPASYTYLTTGQLGHFSPRPTTDTVLTPALYATSMSEIFQAPDEGALRDQLVAKGSAQVDDFVKHWLEANAVRPRVYIGFAALAAGLLAFRLLPLLRLFPAWRRN